MKGTADLRFVGLTLWPVNITGNQQKTSQPVSIRQKVRKSWEHYHAWLRVALVPYTLITSLSQVETLIKGGGGIIEKKATGPEWAKSPNQGLLTNLIAVSTFPRHVSLNTQFGIS